MTWETNFFKGWAKPGPTIRQPSAEKQQQIAQEIGEAITLDALAGHYRIYQLAAGHRFSTDDVLTAWYGTTGCPSARRILDLGSGIGSVGMMAAWRLQGASVVSIEAQAVSAQLARHSVTLNGLASRYQVLEGDFRDSTSLLPPDDLFDLILGSPPYFPPESGVLGNHPQKIACRFETRGTIADYCQAAARQLALGGVFACVFPTAPAAQHARVVQAAAAAGLTLLRSRTVFLKEGEPYSLGVFLMMKSEHLPAAFRSQAPWIEPPLHIRGGADGLPTLEYLTLKLSMGLPPTA